MNYHNRWIRPRLAKTAAAQAVRLPLAPSRERRRIQVYLALLLLDGLAIAASFVLADFAYTGRLRQGWVVMQLALPLYWTSALAQQAYSVPALVDKAVRRQQVLLSLAIAATLLTLLMFVLKSSDSISRMVTFIGFGIAAIAVNAGRSAAAPLIRRAVGPTATNVLVIDDRGDPVRVPHAWHVDAREHGLVPDLADPHMLDRIGLYMANMDRVVVTCTPERRQAWAMIFKSANVQGEVVDREVLSLGVIGARRGRDYGSLIVSAGQLGLRARVIKRLFDFIVALAAVIVLAPLLIVVSILIVLESGFPVLFVQQRLGRGNTFFSIYKFRSMRAERTDHNGSVSTARDDDRVTRIGRFIRCTSIDELPQLFNVLRGDMSLVGPRPHAIGSQAGDKLFWEIDKRYWLRHALKPGLTGLAQIRGFRGATDHESDLEQRLNSDLEYLDGWSLFRDIGILFATVRVLVHHRAF